MRSEENENCGMREDGGGEIRERKCGERDEARW